MHCLSATGCNKKTAPPIECCMEGGAVRLSSQNERCLWLDMAKGVAILLVVLGHSLLKDMRMEYGLINVLHQFIYSFHMQLFMFLSGVAHAIRIAQGKNVDFKYEIKKRLVPWGYYSLLIYICIFCVGRFLRNCEKMLPLEKVAFGAYFLRCFTGNNPYVVHTWFLLALFFICTLFNGISKLSQKNTRRLQVVTGICFLVFRIILIEYPSPWLNQLKRILQYYIFFVAGYYFSDIKKLRCLSRISSALLGVMFTIIACMLLKNKMAAFAVRQIGAVYIIQSVVCVARRSCEKGWGKIWRRLGKCSYPIYLLHHPWCSVILGRLFYGVLNWNLVVVILICTVSGIVLPLLFVKWVQSCETLKWMLGPLGLVKENE